MVLVFVGALFTVLNITLELPTGAVLGLLPDFIGYIMIHVGINRLLERENYLAYSLYNPIIALRFLIGLGILSWLSDIVFPQIEMGLPATPFALLVAFLKIALEIMFWLSFVGALRQVERERTVDLVTDYLALAAVLWKGAQALALIFIFLMLIEQYMTFTVLAGAGTAVFFIIELFRAMRRYEYG